MGSGWVSPGVVSGGGGGPGGPDNTVFIETRTISALEITNKSLQLTQNPSFPAETSLSVVQGSSQAYGQDFIVTVSVLSWNGLGLDGLINAGDEVVITYPITV